jgi:hypothetical protein
VCVGQDRCPYGDPYLLSGVGRCDGESACTLHADSGEHEGYETCHSSDNTWSHVITAWKR